MNNINFDFSGSRYVITGASSGIGKQILIELISAGATVLAIARNLSKLEALKMKYLGKIEIAAIDVCNKDDMDNVINDFVQRYGKLNGSVHAAGIADITALNFYNCNLAKHIMNVTFWAGVDLLQIVTKSKYAQKGTSNVILSSVSAVSAEKGMFAYASAKSAINSGIKSIAKEICKKNHRINSIMPGWINSEMTKNLSTIIDKEQIASRHLLGIGNPDDVSGAVLFLLSDRAKWITGTNMIVDGGYLA